MNRQKVKYITALSIILMIGLQYFLRPAYHHHNWIKVCMGFLPNLLSAIFLPGICFLMLGNRLPKISLNSLFLLHLVIASLLCIYELLQMVSLFGKTFDYLDLLSTFVGTLLSIRLLKHWAHVDVNLYIKHKFWQIAGK